MNLQVLTTLSSCFGMLENHLTKQANLHCGWRLGMCCDVGGVESMEVLYKAEEIGRRSVVR